MDKVIVSAVFAAFLLLLILLAEGRHWATGGKTPGFLERKALHGRVASPSPAQ